jgi:thiamine-monophosphate kinase
VDEFELIDRYFAARSVPREDVRLGIGDDAAIVCPAAGAELAIATDTIVEGTHFPSGTPARAVGHRCLAVNLSDLAAMGASPLWCTLALSLPRGAPEWVGEFADGFWALAAEHDVALVGGDTVRGPLSVTVTVHGRVAPHAAIRRDGAGVDQAIYVTGATGSAAAGLASLRDGRAAAGDELIDRFLYPAPRVREGCGLAAIATAMIDVSDGLHVDLERLLEASGVGALLDVESLPLDASVVERYGRERALDFALHGGDDYELCFTVPAAREAALRERAAGWACGIACIGRTRAGSGLAWREAGRARTAGACGFRHFDGGAG